MTAKCLAIHMEICLSSTSAFSGKMSWAEHKFVGGCICLRNNCYTIFYVHHLDQEFSCWIVTVTQGTDALPLTFKLLFKCRNTGLRNWQNFKQVILHWNVKCWKLLRQSSTTEAFRLSQCEKHRCRFRKLSVWDLFPCKMLPGPDMVETLNVIGF